MRTAYGNLAGAVGIVCNALLCAAKLLVGTLFGSISVTADAVNNLSDASSSIITLVGFKLSAKPADKEHPYGHARIEYLAGPGGVGAYHRHRLRAGAHQPGQDSAPHARGLQLADSGWCLQAASA